MPTLHLGVIDQPYDHSSSGQTTFEVATYLENKYQIMQAFFVIYEEKIATMLAENMSRSLVTMIQNGTFGATENALTLIGTDETMAKIDEMFKNFISSGEAEQVGIPGTPTQAALDGVNHSFAHPYAKDNPRRVSFRDTGLYRDSFIAWVTDP